MKEIVTWWTSTKCRR